MVHFDELIRELMNFRCNVLTENNRFLFFGRIAYYDDVNQIIRVENYYYPTLRKSFYKDTPVNILKDVDSRRYFRQNVMSPSLISHVNNENVKHPCMVVNISGNGIAIQSRSSYEIGDRLWFQGQKFCGHGSTHNVCCEVVRKQLLDNSQYFTAASLWSCGPTKKNESSGVSSSSRPAPAATADNGLPGPSRNANRSRKTRMSA